MTNTELILNMLAEASTKDISQAVNPETFSESKKVVSSLSSKKTFPSLPLSEEEKSNTD